jgi:hypothetical protein
MSRRRETSTSLVGEQGFLYHACSRIWSTNLADTVYSASVRPTNLLHQRFLLGLFFSFRRGMHEISKVITFSKKETTLQITTSKRNQKNPHHHHHHDHETVTIVCRSDGAPADRLSSPNSFWPEEKTKPSIVGTYFAL